VKPRKRYEATCDKHDLAEYMRSGWDVDEDCLPIGDRRPICWRKSWQPLAWPVGWRVVRAGRVWQ
jgi:hypothetical protein